MSPEERMNALRRIATSHSGQYGAAEIRWPGDMHVVAHIRAAEEKEKERCMKLICQHCRNGVPVHWWPGAGGFWAHHDRCGVNIGSCHAGPIRSEGQ